MEKLAALVIFPLARQAGDILRVPNLKVLELLLHCMTNIRYSLLIEFHDFTWKSISPTITLLLLQI